MADENTNVSNETTDNGQSTNNAQSAQNSSNQSQQTNENKPATDIEKLIQRAVDRATNKLGNENKNLKKQLEDLQKSKMSDEEIKNLEIKQKEEEIAQREAALHDKENRLFAIKAIKEEGLDDGSDTVLELIDLVVGGTDDTEETIKTKVKSFSGLVKKMVASEVDKTFKANGRQPNEAKPSSGGSETDNVAVKLGKQRAEQTKRTNDVLNFYTGGKK